jgi:hypothetical protein
MILIRTEALKNHYQNGSEDKDVPVFLKRELTDQVPIKKQI